MSQLQLFERPAAPSFLDGLPDNDEDGLRYYQRDAVNAFYDSLDEGYRRPLMVMATGLGKTQTFGAIAKHWKGRVLVLAHREELVSQAHARLEEMTGELVGVEKAEMSSRFERVVVGSVQTVSKKKRLEKLKMFGGFSLVIVDEAHHYVAKSYRRPIEYFDATTLGVTATPWRGDKRALGKVFDTVCYEKGILDGIEEGFLVPLKGCQVDVQSIDLRQVKVSAGDFVKSQLDAEVLKGVEGIVQKTLELYPRRRGPIFFPGKASAVMAASRFNALKEGSAAVVTDDTPSDERRRIMAAVRRGDIQYLCNVMVATEGFDWPEANLVGLARPTKSYTVHTQMIGRGTRTTADVNSIAAYDQTQDRLSAISQSNKQDCVVLDFVGNCGKHEPVKLVDIFQGRFSDAEVKLAKKLERQDPGSDPRENLNKARKELQRLAKSYQSTVSATVKRFDLFAATGISSKASAAYTARYGFEPATYAQRILLDKWGVPTDSKTSKSDASKAINALRKRRQKGLATPKQLQVLFRQGWDQRNITFETASFLLNYCRTKKWKADLQGMKQALKERRHESSGTERQTGTRPRAKAHE